MNDKRRNFHPRRVEAQIRTCTADRNPVEPIRWLRRLVLRAVSRRLLAEAALLIVVAGLVATATIGFDPQVLGALLAGGVLWGALRALTAAMSNPLSRRYLRSYVRQSFVFEMAPLEPVERAPVTVLGRFGFQRAGAIRDRAGNPSLSFELLTVPSRLVCAAVGHAPGSTVLLSRLNDGRLLVSTTLLVPPGRGLVVNVVPDADEGALAVAHQSALSRADAYGVRAVATPPAAFLDLVRLEREAYRALGLWCATFLDLSGRGANGRLLVPVPLADVLERSLAGTGGPPVRLVSTPAMVPSRV